MMAKGEKMTKHCLMPATQQPQNLPGGVMKWVVKLTQKILHYRVVTQMIKMVIIQPSLKLLLNYNFLVNLNYENH